MGVYAVELLFSESPSIGRLELLSAVRQFSPKAELLGKNEESGPLAILQPDLPVSYSDGPVVPAQVALFPTTKGPDPAKLEPAVAQSWGFAGAKEAVARATACALLTDIMAGPLNPKDRLSAFQRVLDGVLQLAQPLALYWQAADHIVDPADYVAGIPRDYPDLLSAAVNVRLFRVEGGGEPGDTIMDTRGLDVFGLPDLQCHFRGLEPNDLAPLLYNTAAYVFENGDVIEDGNTVSGLQEGDKWICRHEVSLAEPEREVLDINPGPRFAAGGR